MRRTGIKWLLLSLAMTATMTANGAFAADGAAAPVTTSEIKNAEAPADAKKADGKTLFLAAKCNRCHTIDVASIKVLPKTAGDPAEEGEKEEKSEKAKKPVDLSKIGADHDVAAISAWVRRETLKDKKKHKMKYKGTEAELAVIAEWLASLK